MRRIQEYLRRSKAVSFIYNTFCLKRVRAVSVPGSIPSTAVLAFVFVFTVAIPLVTLANEPMSSDNYRLDPSNINSFGGLSDNDEYELLDSGGESVVGLSDSPSYKLSQGYIEQLEQGIELNVFPSDIAAYYPFNTGTGIQAYDVTPNNNQGVLTNSPSWVNGKVGAGALDFPGSSSVYTDHGDTNDQTGSFSLSAWVNPNDVSTSGQRIVVKDDGSNGWALSLADGGTGQIRFYIRGTSPVSTDTGNIIETGSWYHVVAVFDTAEDTKTIYVNGNQEARDSGVTGDPVDNSSNLLVGENFDGTIDEVKISNQPLSADDVQDEYTASDANIPNALTLPRLDTTASQTVSADAIVRTDAGGYDLSIEQTKDLTRESGSATIPAISGTISNPELWDEGTTTGFGFTVTDAVQRDSKWGTDPDFKYAAVPDTSTTYHSRTGLSGGFKETTSMQFRIGVGASQPPGMYKNKLGFTATLKP